MKERYGEQETTDNLEDPSDGCEAGNEHERQQGSPEGGGAVSNQAAVRAREGAQGPAAERYRPVLGRVPSQGPAPVIEEWCKAHPSSQQPGESLDQWLFRRMIEIDRENEGRELRASVWGY